MKAISKPCLAGMHATCKDTRETCGCGTCHLGPCSRCGRDNLGRIFDGLCSDCKRDEAHAAPKPVMACVRCGASGAYRNPMAEVDEFLCCDCHVATNGREPVAAVHVARCAGRDVADPSHVWVQVRGTKFRCHCGTTKYDVRLRDARRRAEENA